MRSRGRRLVAAALGLVAAVLVGGAFLAGVPPDPHPQSSTAAETRVIAHRGGMGLWPENTLFAFRRAVASGVDGLDLDVRLSADGVPVVVHDAAVDRTTEGRGLVAELPVRSLQSLDAGHRWSSDGGRTHPYRGRGISIPTLAEVFRALPHVPMGIEIKRSGPAMPVRLCDAISAAGMRERVLVASFQSAAIREFRSACPGVATSATFPEALGFYVRSRLGLDTELPRAHAFQVPLRFLLLDIPTREFVRAAHRLDVGVEAWVANELDEMRNLLRSGVDGIITDYPGRLRRLLRRGAGQTPPR